MGVTVENRQANIPLTMERVAGRFNWDTLNCVIHEPAEPGDKDAAPLLNSLWFEVRFYN